MDSLNSCKTLITLGQLLHYLCCGEEIIQIVNGSSWDIYDIMHVNSVLLKPFIDYQIKELEIIDQDIIRISLIEPEEKNGSES